jgi:hypothetical protein
MTTDMFHLSEALSGPFQREVIRIRKSKMDRQHNGQKKKDERTNNNLQNSTQKAKIEQHEPR